MPRITLYVHPALRARMASFEINWSKVAQEAFREAMAASGTARKRPVSPHAMVPGEVDGFYPDAPSKKLIEQFGADHVEGSVLLLEWTRDEGGVSHLSNAKPLEAVAMAAQFINGMAQGKSEEEE